MTSPMFAHPDGPLGVVLAKLQKVTKNGDGFIARCPAHDDGRPSLSVTLGDKGVVLHCFAGCQPADICRSIGLDLKDLFVDAPAARPRTGEVIATYDYHDAEGKLRFQVLRFFPKDFRQRSLDARGEWIPSMKGVERVLYHLPELLKAKAAGNTIIVVEGEKDADNLRGLGLIATTNPGGAKKWQASYTETLRGARVVIIPDSDKAGHAHRDLVALALHGVASSVRVVEVPAPHKDISDWITAGGTKEQLIEMAKTAPLYDPSAAAAATADVIELPIDRPGRNDQPPPSGPTLVDGQPRKFHKTDIGNGERLVALHGDDIRFIPEWRSWEIWDGRRWERDRTHEIERRAKGTIRHLLEESRNLNLRSDERLELVKFMMKSEADARVRAMINRAAAEPGIAITPAKLDADHYLLNVANGTLDLRTGQLRPHRREDLITKLVPIAYDADAECPTWLAFLDRIMAGNEGLIRFLQMAIGYALTGETTEQCFFLCYGTGANGKTTLLEILRAIAGDYATQADFNTFLERKNDGPRNDVARLFGARVVTSSEVGEGKRLNESLMKSLTGSERIAARFLYAELFEFDPTFKLFLAANHRPVIRGTDHGIWRRVRLIPFTVQIPPEQQDRDLLSKLRAELPGILAWAIAGCQLWLERGGLETPDEVLAAGAEYRSESDIIGAFIDEYCELAPGFAEPAGALYQAYAEWCDAGGEFQMSQTMFGRRLEERGITVERRGAERKKYRLGVKLLHRPLSASPKRDRVGSSEPDLDAEGRLF